MRRLRSASAAPLIQLRSPEPRKEMTKYVPSRSALLKLKRTTVGDKTAVALPVLMDSSWTFLTSACRGTIDVNPNPMPVNGWISIQGFSDSMDDRLFVKEDFCRSDIFGGKPSHFFAVYDGHGGPRVILSPFVFLFFFLLDFISIKRNRK